jgi:hypothetical protein
MIALDIVGHAAIDAVPNLTRRPDVHAFAIHGEIVVQVVVRRNKKTQTNGVSNPLSPIRAVIR